MGSGRPCRARTCDQRIMRTTSAFAARFRFVVWTLPCLSAFPSSLYTFCLEQLEALRSASAWHEVLQRSPNLRSSTPGQSQLALGNPLRTTVRTRGVGTVPYATPRCV